MKNLVPQDFDKRMQYCEVLAKSNLIPKDFRGKPEDILVAIDFGFMIGLNPMQALTNIAVINGRPSIWGDAALALVKASGKLEYIEEYFENEWTAVTKVKRKDEPVEVIRKFSKKDAEVAGLWNKNTWNQYPKRMLQMRARSWALRDAFPDVLSGIFIREEIEDVEVVEETAKSEIEPIKTLPQKEKPLYEIVGNLLIEKYKDAAMIKKIVRQVLDLPADTELKGKYLKNFTEDELKRLHEFLTKDEQEELTLQTEKA